MPTDHGLRPDDLQSVQRARCQPIQPGKYKTVDAAEGQSLRRFTSQSRLMGSPSGRPPHPTTLVARCASQQGRAADVRVGSKADLRPSNYDVRSSADSGHRLSDCKARRAATILAPLGLRFEVNSRSELPVPGRCLELAALSSRFQHGHSFSSLAELFKRFPRSAGFDRAHFCRNARVRIVRCGSAG